MKLGSDTLKQYIEEKDLSVDRIDDVFTYIEDTLMDFDEIESAIKQNQSVVNVNDEEFEEEFDKLLKEETDKNNKSNINTIETKPDENKNDSRIENKIESSDMSTDSIQNTSGTIEKLSEKVANLAL